MVFEGVAVAVEWGEPALSVVRTIDADLELMAVYCNQGHVHQNAVDDQLDNLERSGWALEVAPPLGVYDILCFLCSVCLQKLALKRSLWKN